MDHGEDPRAGILRELKGELGLDNLQINGIAVVKTFYLEQKSSWLLWVVYEVEPTNQEFVLGDGVSDARYIKISELEQSEDIFEKWFIR